MTKEEKLILQVLRNQDKIRRNQSWWLDLSSNVAGNALFDGAVWLIKKLSKLR